MTTSSQYSSIPVFQHSPSFPLIGLSGKIGTGKTMLSSRIIKADPRFTRTAFGDILKTETAARFGFPVVFCYSEPGKDTLIPKTGIMTRDMTVRELLQWYGTDVCRAKDPEYWTKKTKEVLEGTLKRQPVIIDDVRFPNEATLVRNLGGLLVRLEPYLGWRPGSRAGHASETALDREQGWDLVLAPKFGELDWAAGVVLEKVVEVHGSRNKEG